MAKTFIDEFGIVEEDIDIKDIPDYETFTNKELLDDLRNKIIQNLIDNNTNNEISMDSYISEQIEKTLEGYDLSVIERSYINNLIDNEIDVTDEELIYESILLYGFNLR